MSFDEPPERHEPVNISEQMREAAGETPERKVPRPGQEHQVERIAKRETKPAG